MELRIGTTLDGDPAVVDTSSTRPLVLLADPGHGKTTLLRYLARWWLADTGRHLHLFSAWPEEWADLPLDRVSLNTMDPHPAEDPESNDANVPVGGVACAAVGGFVGGAGRGSPGRHLAGRSPCRREGCLLVIDDADRMVRALAGHALAGPPAVLSTFADDLADVEGLPLLDDGYRCFGLLDQIALTMLDVEVRAGQGRLDWPATAVPVVADRRGSLDLPCHRWRNPLTSYPTPPPASPPRPSVTAGVGG